MTMLSRPMTDAELTEFMRYIDEQCTPWPSLARVTILRTPRWYDGLLWWLGFKRYA